MHIAQPPTQFLRLFIDVNNNEVLAVSIFVLLERKRCANYIYTRILNQPRASITLNQENYIYTKSALAEGNY